MSKHYLKSPGHAKRLSEAMDDFEKGLMKRWREEVTDDIVADKREIVTRIKREGSPHEPPLWDAWSLPARHHLTFCTYIDWVEGGQKGSLGSVSCDGKTGANEDVSIPDIEGGETVTIPPNIECGMGSILEQVANWAGGERDHAYYELPLFDDHDVNEIETAHSTFTECGKELGLGMDGDSVGAASEEDLVGTVRDLTANKSAHKDWWAGWTGLAATEAKSNFFSSPSPTANNQARILGALANLYSLRAAIIIQGRHEGLHWVEWATASCKKKETTTHDLTPAWKVVQGVGGAISIGGSWSGVGAAVGGSVSLVGFLGENLLSEVKTEDYAHSVTDIVETLNDKITKLNSDLDDRESDYRTEISTLRSEIWDVHSFNLELYDLTENNSTGVDGEPKTGYSTNVADVLAIGEMCYLAGDLYTALLSKIKKTDDADKHLAGEDGEPIAADGSLIGVREMLESFVKTACGRYLMAGDQIKASAEDYVKIETDQKESFDKFIRSWETHGVGGDPGFDPEDYADDTDRSDSAGDPTDITKDPGEDDGESYVTEENP